MGLPEGTPSHWLVYFSVADTDAATAAAERSGGTVVSPADGHAVRPDGVPRRPGRRRRSWSWPSTARSPVRTAPAETLRGAPPGPCGQDGAA